MSEMVLPIRIIDLFVYFLYFQSVNGLENPEDPNCEELFTLGYGYRTYFRIPASSFLPDGSVIFNFTVKARSDAHILFCEQSTPLADHPVYEIVIGAGRNSFSDIRRLRRAATRASQLTKNILSGNATDRFWFRKKDGLLMVGKDGFGPFLSWTDREPLDIKYMSFSTWGEVVGTWKYDCKEAPPAKENSTIPRGLKESLLGNYDPYALPVSSGSVISVDALLSLNYIDLDAKKSAMTVQGTFLFMWYDPKLKWEPSEFGQVTSLNLNQRLIWQPDFILYNAVGDGSSPMGKTWFTIESSGLVKWFPPFKLVTYCNLDLSDWPWDQHQCQVKLGLFSFQDSIDVNVSTNSTQPGERSSSEWELTSLVAETRLVRTPWQEELPQDELDENPKTALILTIYLKRRTQTYYTLLLVPLFIIMITSLCSFWLSPIHMERICLNLISQILLTVYLVRIDELLPALTKDTPYLLLAYSRMQLLATICTMSSLWVICITKSKVIRSPPSSICKLLKSPLLQTLFFLPLKQNYTHLSEPKSLRDQEENDPKKYWLMLSQIIDRIMFAIVLSSFIIIISL